MASLFDQYEQASQRFKTPQSALNRPEISTTGFINMKLEEEAPIFSKHKVNFSPTDSITHLSVGSEYLVLAMANNVLLRIDLRQPDKVEEVELGKMATHSRLSGLFLDPLGQHILLSLTPRDRLSDGQPELVYLSRRSTKLKPATKLRGHEVSAVGWNHANESDATTGPILLGTNKGLIFETEIGVDGDRMFQTSLEQYWRQVFDIGKGSAVSITGVEFHRVPGSLRHAVVVTTCDRLYQFTGAVSGLDDRPLLQQIFNYYLTVPEGFLEIPSTIKYSRLQFCHASPRGPPKTFGWLVERGIFHGQVDLSGTESVLAGSRLMEYTPPTPPPLGFIVTEFHALLLYPDLVRGVSLLNHELVFEDVYNESLGRLAGITRDAARGTIWAHTDRAVFRYKVTREQRNAWRVYLERRDFERAKQFCRDDPQHLDQVVTRQAEVHFEKKQYEMSALLYAETRASFEEVSLKFLRAWETEALKLYLQKKLDALEPGDKTQATMITVWVVELFMNQLGTMRDAGDRGETYRLMEKQLDSFLALPQVVECVRNNRQVIYDLMASHGDKENLIKLTIMNKDFERVIRQHIHMKNYLEALDVLKSQPSTELFYQFAPALIVAAPAATIAALTARGRSLDAARLLPALVAAEEHHASDVVRYLETCVAQGCSQRAVHNYLLNVYAKHKPDKLMPYLAVQGEDASMVQYDVHYALRLCRERGLSAACVQLSALLGLWEAAVDLALTVSVDLARQTAAMPHDDPELRRKLWLKIARHVVKEKEDVEQAMQFLQQCDLIKIEDILPFFSDFVTIDQFRDAVCASLEEYNRHITEIKEEMEEATRSAEVIRGEVASFKSRHAYVHSSDTCDTCSIQLLLRPFYLFPCGHRFHGDCLVAELSPLLAPGRRHRLADLQRQLATLRGDAASVGSASMATRDQIKADIDAVVAAECLYCGEMMIQSIDKPFIEDEDFDTVAKEWE